MDQQYGGLTRFCVLHIECVYADYCRNCALYDNHLRLAYYEESKINFWRISGNAFIINEDVVLATWHSASSENNALRHLFMQRFIVWSSATFIAYATRLCLFYFVQKR